MGVPVTLVAQEHVAMVAEQHHATNLVTGRNLGDGRCPVDEPNMDIT